MSSLVIAGLLGVALVDGACSGFRSGLGRTGLIRHGADDLRATALGVALVMLFLVPAAAVFVIDVTGSGPSVAAYSAAGAAILWVLFPYVVVVLLALSAYAVLGWRQKYVAMAVVLGPLTLARPAVALGAGLVGWSASTSSSMTASIALAVLGALLVGPALNRRWSHDK